MLACFCGRNGLRSVQVDRRRDVDRIDLAIAQHVAPIRVPLPRAKLFREGFSQICLRPADGHKLRPWGVAQGWGDAFLCDVATTDKSPSNFCHLRCHVRYALACRLVTEPGAVATALNERIAQG